MRFQPRNRKRRIRGGGGGGGGGSICVRSRYQPAALQTHNTLWSNRGNYIVVKQKKNEKALSANASLLMHSYPLPRVKQAPTCTLKQQSVFVAAADVNVKLHGSMLHSAASSNVPT